MDGCSMDTSRRVVHGHAVISYFEALWLENRDSGVQFLCLCPPAVKTPMLPDLSADKEMRKRSMAVEPDEVLDAMEKGLAKGRFLVLLKSAGTMYAMRRASPVLLRRVISAQRFQTGGTMVSRSD